MVPQSIENLKAICKDIRADIVKMTAAAGSGHPGGSLSSVELLAALYFNVLNHRPEEPNWPDRDRFILSKGHVCPVLYSVMARTGYFPVEELMTLRKFGSRLQGHPNVKVLPGLESSSGSLGQGLSIANGLALAAKLNNKSYRVYCLMGDGELQEGQIWEAAMSAAHFKLDNLVAILDNNNLQISGDVDKVMSPYPIDQKFAAFGFEIIHIDGNDMNQIEAAFQKARTIKGKPTLILAKTVKGKGVSYMENNYNWHGAAPNKEQYEQAVQELDAEIARLEKEVAAQ